MKTSYMDLTDALWEISFMNRGASELNELVPLYDAEVQQEPHYVSRHYIEDPSTRLSSEGDLVVTVLELREEGVFNRVSTELWEASILLCAYLIYNPDVLHTEGASLNILELGCGCGLVGLVASQLTSRESSSLPHCVTCSDYDIVALKLLEDNLVSGANFSTCTSPKSSLNSFEICHLDWFDYASDNTITESNTKYDVIFGSALVYSPTHVVLADVLR